MSEGWPAVGDGMCPYCQRPQKPGKSRICGHPRCVRTHRTMNEVARQARVRVEERTTRPAEYPPGYWGADTSAQREIIAAVEEAMPKASTLADAFTTAAVVTGNTVAQVMSVWKAAA